MWDATCPDTLYVIIASSYSSLAIIIIWIENTAICNFCVEEGLGGGRGRELCSAIQKMGLKSHIW